MPRDIKAFYDDNAELFDQEQNDFGFVRGPEWEAAFRCLRQISKNSHSLLEIGAGTGRFSLEMAPMVGRVTAVDLSPKMLEVLKEKAVLKGLTNVTTVCGDFLELPFSEKFDVIMAFSALEYIKPSNALFKKISELLKPGGHLIFSFPHDTFFRWWGRMGNYFRQGVFMEAFSKKKMRRVLSENQLSVIEMDDICMKKFFVKGIMLFVYAKKDF